MSTVPPPYLSRVQTFRGYRLINDWRAMDWRPNSKAKLLDPGLANVHQTLYSPISLSVAGDLDQDIPIFLDGLLAICLYN